MRIRKRVGSGLLVAIGLALLLPFAGCSSNDTPAYPVIAVTPVPTARGLYASGSHQNFNSGEYVAYPIDLTVSGVLDITVDWTFPSSWIYVYFGASRCTYDELAKGTCPFLLSSETQQPKPRALVTQPLAVGQYYLVLYNVPYDARTKKGSDATETVTYQAYLTVTSSSGERLPVQMGAPIVVPRLRR